MMLKHIILGACGALALTAAGCELDEIEAPPPTETPTPSPGETPDPEPTPEPPSPVEPGPGGGNGDIPQALFERDVFPAITAACSGAACHSAQTPVFVAELADESYSLTMNQAALLFVNFDPVTARIVVNGEGAHYGATYTPEQLVGLEGWLAAEAAAVEAGEGGEPSPLAQWSGCMNYDEFLQENVAKLWAEKGTGQGDCEQCHNLGGDGFIANQDSVLTFTALTTDAGHMIAYFTVNELGDVIINRDRLQAVADGREPHLSHPGFNVDGNAMEALTRFHSLTQARVASGDCEPPRLVR